MIPAQLFNRIHTLPKLSFGLILGTLTSFLFWQESRNIPFNILMGWDIFCLSNIILFWITFFSIDKQQVRHEAKVLNTNAFLIFFFSIILIMASLGIIILLFIQQGKEEKTTPDLLALVTEFGGLILSWLLLHTLFTIHYAHKYWTISKSSSGYERGLKFPEDNNPDYLDFAYFSFVNGMTFQVSDVSVTSKTMRILVLFHCLLAFMFNTIIVALSINLIAGLM